MPRSSKSASSLQSAESTRNQLRGKPPGQTAPLVRENMTAHYCIGGDLEATRRAFDEPAKIDVLAVAVFEALRRLRKIETRLNVRDGFGAVLPTVRESRGIHVVSGRAA